MGRLAQQPASSIQQHKAQPRLHPLSAQHQAQLPFATALESSAHRNLLLAQHVAIIQHLQPLVVYGAADQLADAGAAHAAAAARVQLHEEEAGRGRRSVRGATLASRRRCACALQHQHQASALPAACPAAPASPLRPAPPPGLRRRPRPCKAGAGAPQCGRHRRRPACSRWGRPRTPSPCRRG